MCKRKNKIKICARLVKPWLCHLVGIFTLSCVDGSGQSRSSCISVRPRVKISRSPFFLHAFPLPRSLSPISSPPFASPSGRLRLPSQYEFGARRLSTETVDARWWLLLEKYFLILLSSYNSFIWSRSEDSKTRNTCFLQV